MSDTATEKTTAKQRGRCFGSWVGLGSRPTRRPGEAGYSLVEVLAAIVVLSIAVIPMVGMFDMGVQSATKSGQYDVARALANKKLEQAKGLPFQAAASTTDLEDNFPYTAPTTKATGTSFTPDITSSTEAGIPAGFSYKVRKRYVRIASTGPSTSNLTTSGASTTDGMILVIVTVNWGSSNSYTVTSIIARGSL